MNKTTDTIVIDPAGEPFTMTDHFREKSGQPVLKFDTTKQYAVQGWTALTERQPTMADADSNGDVLFLRSGAGDCLGRVKTGIPADATHWRHTGRA